MHAYITHAYVCNYNKHQFAAQIARLTHSVWQDWPRIYVRVHVDKEIKLQKWRD
jgi:hypothetical protein